VNHVALNGLGYRSALSRIRRAVLIWHVKIWTETKPIGRMRNMEKAVIWSLVMMEGVCIGSVCAAPKGVKIVFETNASHEGLDVIVEEK
tara:strand:- start:66 stop:332 length:267 start_codon:yes stop_codon:yes gene_type:complete